MVGADQDTEVPEAPKGDAPEQTRADPGGGGGRVGVGLTRRGAPQGAVGAAAHATHACNPVWSHRAREHGAERTFHVMRV